jgi:hypothetical protein
MMPGQVVSAKRAYTEPSESTLYSMRRPGEQVANYGSRLLWLQSNRRDGGDAYQERKGV